MNRNKKTIAILTIVLFTMGLIGYNHNTSANDSLGEISIDKIENLQIQTNQIVEVAQQSESQGVERVKAKPVEEVKPVVTEAVKVPALTCNNGSKSYKEVLPEHAELMTNAGIAKSEHFAAGCIIYMESGWNYKATNPTSGAYGLPQSLPATKMGSAGEDWKTNPVTQLKWADEYATSRYGSWTKALNFWNSNKWW